jgi:hypothetical protein
MGAWNRLFPSLVLQSQPRRTIGLQSQEDPGPAVRIEEAGAADRPCQVACDRHSLPCSLTMPQKAQNEANPESTQSLLPLVIKSSATEPAGGERSRSAAGGAVPHDAGNNPFDPIAPAREGNGRARGRECRSLV